MTVSAYDNHSNLFRSSYYGKNLLAYLLESRQSRNLPMTLHVLLLI